MASRAHPRAAVCGFSASRTRFELAPDARCDRPGMAADVGPGIQPRRHRVPGIFRTVRRRIRSAHRHRRDRGVGADQSVTVEAKFGNLRRRFDMPQTNQAADEVHTLRIEKDLFIAASPEIVWESVLDEVGPQMCPRDEVMPMTL